jgi:farnesyl-diphosphate farnesyltransferase
LSDDAAPVPDFLAEPIGENPAERQLMHELPVLIDRLRALEPAYRDAAYYGAHEMMRGVRIFLRRAEERGRPYPAVQTPEEMREYCYFVAGVVGIFLNQMMAHYLGMPQLLQLRELSVELGIGLQLVNVLKDALKDSEQGRRYLPAVEDGRLEPADVYRIALDEARRSLRRGVDFVLALPAHAAELRHFCGLPIAWGALTLERAERDAAGAKINRATLMDSIVRFKQLATDDQALRDWLSGMLRKDDQAFAASNRS